MTVIVKDKGDLIVPTAVRRQAGIKAGDRLEFKVSGGVITIVLTLPSDTEELTPEQRRIIDGQLAEGLKDIREGRVSRRFDTVDERLASMKKGGKRSARQKSRSQ